MTVLEILGLEYLSIIFGGLSGGLTAWFTQRVLSKRGVFRYSVAHNRIGLTAEDQIFGKVAVTWNDNPIANLYLSTVEIKNESLNDYDNVALQVYTSDTKLLSEQSQILDTPNIIEWSDRYKEKIDVPSGEQPSEVQKNIYFGQREYLVPIFNRGQTIRITYLNSATMDTMPHIWVSAEQKGVRVKFQGPQNMILGIPQPRAAIVGVLIGILVIIPFVMTVSDPWILSFFAFSYGLFAQIPGAYAIKAYGCLRELIGG